MLGDDAWLPAAMDDDVSVAGGTAPQGVWVREVVRLSRCCALGLAATPSTNLWPGCLCAGGEQEEVLTSGRPDEGLAAARGSGGQPDVLQVTIITAGPFTKRGTYR
jgi:hypothetical protein